MKASGLQAELRRLSDPKRAAALQRYFKTGKGEYAEGDVFLGVTTPQMKAAAKRYHGLPLPELRKLLASAVHTDRSAALDIMVNRFKRGDATERGRVYRLYVSGLDRVNNWDLVDCSAPHIVGEHLRDRDKAVLLAWAASPVLWRRRAAVLATFAYIKDGSFSLCLRLARTLLSDPEDLMHKAVGWMLREIGKRDQASLEKFLSRHCRRMPRTMLRYAIERFPERLRQAYLKGTPPPARP
ncbi:MAG: DNA alkylation repair protein [Elusimicrobia bacterium]|nr:DNA alkylation repair protein [Elusimicrobiota bacterium]